MDILLEVVLVLIALVLTIVTFLAQIRLFSIDRTLKQIRADLEHDRAPELEPPTDPAHSCPRCTSSQIEVYERSREGEGWICRKCGHSWRVPAQVTTA